MIILSHTLSSLVRQLSKLGSLPAAKWWLVWEPGKWIRPPSDEDDTGSIDVAKGLRTEVADALCYPLTAPTRSKSITIGRHRQCDLIVNDATVSRRHAVLRTTTEGWAIQGVERAKKIRVHGQELSPEMIEPLASGDVIELGGTKLTVLNAEALQARVSKQG